MNIINNKTTMSDYNSHHRCFVEHLKTVYNTFQQHYPKNIQITCHPQIQKVVELFHILVIRFKTGQKKFYAVIISISIKKLNKTQNKIFIVINSIYSMFHI